MIRRGATEDLSTLSHNAAQHLFDGCGYQRIQVVDAWIQYEKTL